ncbi:MAG: anaerobic ribonucleoside-triphosphate reductase activating protein [Lachnospiraceae bacterium]|nr:anaerobic ribonucleoside-triphosphate reductase activating protein [Lachnospiraceae bacterium]
MIINGLQKTTLLDYPTKVAATVFFGGCNFRCPFCHNMNLVLHPEEALSLSEEEVLTFLKSRQGILDGVCITGGEPTLQKDLPAFIGKIKDLGYAVKLDTNGTNPKMLSDLVSRDLLDHVAMDIKTAPDRYPEVCGLTDPDLAAIRESVSFLLTSDISYEFRTTVVKEYHTEEVMLLIGEWIRGAKAYYLQSYKDSEFVPDHSLHACEKEELLHFEEILTPFVRSVSLRGVD